MFPVIQLSMFIIFVKIKTYTLHFNIISKKTHLIYYKPNCNKNDIEYIAYSNTECERTRIGLESMGITTNTTKYLNICGKNAVKYCIKVDENNKVYYTTAVGNRPNPTCSENNYKFISNLCECSQDLNSKCINTQKFKLANCRNSNDSSLISIIPSIFLS